MKELIFLEQATHAIAKVATIGEAKAISDQAAVIKVFAAKQGWSAEQRAKIAEIELRAAVRLGVLLKEMRPERSKGGRPKTNSTVESVFQPEVRALGVSAKQSHLAQQAASIPADKLDLHLATKRANASVSGLVKEHQKEVKRRQQLDAIAEFKLPAGRFHVIVADPPWSYTKRKHDDTHRGNCPYPPMEVDEIELMKVPDMSLHDCILWLWTTNAFMVEAHGVATRWGFDVKTILTWVKDRFGVGEWLRGQTEHCLLCVKGHPAVMLTNQSTVITAARREHSRKPDEFYNLVDGLCPGSKVELFSRTKRQGWSCVGAEIGEFSDA